MKKKGLAMVLALVLLAVCAVSGTLAWLTAKSDEVTNTFTASDIEVKLDETKGTTVTGGKEFKMIPGYTIGKDPKATVLAGSEECYLFVKLEKSTNFDTYLEYAIADGWTKLTTDKDGNNITDLIYYRKVLTNDIGTAYSVLANDQVTVKGEVTKAMMDGLTKETLPKLTVTAYASQLYKSAGVEFTAAEAWANVNP